MQLATSFKLVKNCTDEFINIDINHSEVYQKLRGLKVNKSTGPDGLHPRILKETACITCIPLTIIFRKSLSTAVIPDDWKLANIVPIFKKENAKCQETIGP